MSANRANDFYSLALTLALLPYSPGRRYWSFNYFSHCTIEDNRQRSSSCAASSISIRCHENVPHSRLEDAYPGDNQ